MRQSGQSLVWIVIGFIALNASSANGANAVIDGLPLGICEIPRLYLIR